MYFPKASNTRIQTNPPRPTQRKRDSAVIRRDTLKQRPLSQSSLFSVDGGHLLNKERQALIPFLVSAWPWKITCILLKNSKVSLTPDIMYRAWKWWLSKTCLWPYVYPNSPHFQNPSELCCSQSHLCIWRRNWEEKGHQKKIWRWDYWVAVQRIHSASIVILPVDSLSLVGNRPWIAIHWIKAHLGTWCSN